MTLYKKKYENLAVKIADFTSGIDNDTNFKITKTTKFSLTTSEISVNKEIIRIKDIFELKQLLNFLPEKINISNYKKLKLTKMEPVLIFYLNEIQLYNKNIEEIESDLYKLELYKMMYILGNEELQLLSKILESGIIPNNWKIDGNYDNNDSIENFIDYLCDKSQSLDNTLKKILSKQNGLTLNIQIPYNGNDLLNALIISMAYNNKSISSFFFHNLSLTLADENNKLTKASKVN